MLGIQLNRDGKAVYEACLDNGLIINCTQGNILRLMPALNVTKKQADKAVFILRKVLNQITQR
jgi:acetylornithine/N-succinyldiaminopimelate aminotransferase